jgi:hypothetical protein
MDGQGICGATGTGRGYWKGSRRTARRRGTSRTAVSDPAAGDASPGPQRLEPRRTAAVSDPAAGNGLPVSDPAAGDAPPVSDPIAGNGLPGSDPIAGDAPPGEPRRPPSPPRTEAAQGDTPALKPEPRAKFSRGGLRLNSEFLPAGPPGLDQGQHGN